MTKEMVEELGYHGMLLCGSPKTIAELGQGPCSRGCNMWDLRRTESDLCLLVSFTQQNTLLSAPNMAQY